MTAFDTLLWIGENTARVAILLLAASALAFLFRRSAARLRYAIWCAGVVGALIVPILMLAIPGWDLPLLAHRSDARPAAVDRLSLEKLEAELFAPLGAADRQALGVAATAATAATSLWLIGLVSVLAWLITGVVRVDRIARRGTPLDGGRWGELLDEARRAVGLRAPVRLIASGGADTPITWGAIRPVIVLPAGADSWPDDCKRVVLLHELIHVRRCDWVFQIAAQVVCAANWFNPLAWIAARRLAGEREHACDDAVIAGGTPATRYAEHLLDVAEAMSSPALTPVAALSLAARPRLERRLQSILGATRRAVPRRLAVPVLAGMACLAVAAASFEPMTGLCAVAPSEVEMKLKSGDLHLKKGDLRAALAVYEELTRTNPECGDAWFKLGYTLHTLGDLDRAVVAHLKAATFPEVRATALYNAGCAYALKGDPKMALAALEVASETGLSNKSWLMQDPDLKSLHGDKRFEEIVAKVPDSASYEIMDGEKEKGGGEDGSSVRS